MGRHLTNSGLILPVIRKVISRDGAYVCCICRSEYKTKVEANNCLNHCWYDVQHLYPVVLRKLNGRHVVFRCQYCCRDYEDESSALSCARRCRGERNHLHIREQLLNDLPIEAPSHRPSRIRLVAVKAMPGHPLAKPQVEDVVDQPEDVDVDSEVDVVSEDDIVTDTPEGPARKSKADFPKQWTRMDARYQCAYCKNLFYTKVETEACFSDHFDADGYEKIAS